MSTSSMAMPPAAAGARLSDFLLRCRDWLDGYGRKAWIAAMVLGFVTFWPLGLAVLFYMIWSNRMFSSKKGCSASRYTAPTTGNTAFDAYREQTLKRLEDEHAEFMEFLAKLREATDKAEFDQFMDRRRVGPDA